MKRRERESYLSKSLDKRKAQLANLFRGKTALTHTPFLNDPRNLDIRYFIEHHFILEDGKPMKLYPEEKGSLLNPVYPPDGSRPFSVAIWGLPRKAGKSTLSAACGLWELLFSDKIYGTLEPEIYCLAKSRDQARIIFGKIVKAARRSPEIKAVLKIYRDRMVNESNGGVLRTLSADRDLQEGLNASMVLLDEASISEWNLWITMLTSTLMREGSGQKPISLLTTTAGHNPASQFHRYFEKCSLGNEIRTYYYWGSKNTAPWMTDEVREQFEANLSPAEKSRYLYNEWVLGENAFVTADDISRCLDPRLQPQYAGKQGIKYVCALDIGLRGDRTCCLVCHASDNTIVVDQFRTFAGTPKKPVLFDEIMEHLQSIHSLFNNPVFVIDLWQAEMLVQKLKSMSYKVEEFQPTSSAMYRLSGNLYSLVHNGTIKFWKDEQLINELQSVIAIQKSSGIRIEHRSGQFSDIVISLGMAAMEITKKPWWKRSGKPGVIVGPQKFDSKAAVAVGPSPYFGGAKPNFHDSKNYISQPSGSRYKDPTLPGGTGGYERPGKAWPPPSKIDYDQE